MALIKCSECKKEISNKADLCPHCGRKLRKTPWGCLTILLLSGLIIAAIISSESDKTKQNLLPQLNIEAGWSETRLRIKNINTLHWNYMEIYLNGPHYRWKGLAPQKGETKYIPFSDFTKRNGERFNPAMIKPVKVEICGDGYAPIAF